MATPSESVTTPGSAYIHIPFCRHRCGYCNFSLVAGRDHLINSFLDALELEIRQSDSSRLQTLFIGGGTPTHLSLGQLSRLFGILEDHFEIDEECEFSVEGNPSDFDSELIHFLREKRVNRISLGVQSMDLKKLEFLERDHNQEIVTTVASQLAQTIPNFSIDLIIGTPGETETAWIEDLDACLRCQPKHVSTYSLTIEKGTQFWNRQLHEQPMRVDEERAAELYESGIEHLDSNGFRQYEVSNFSLAGYECLHNINYWNGGEYYGFGPGAARYVAATRASNHASPTQYIKRVLNNEDPTVESEVLNAEQQARERLIFGLRQTDGIHLDNFEQRTGFSCRVLVGNPMNLLLDQGLLQLSDGVLKLTRKGLLVSDSIWPFFL